MSELYIPHLPAEVIERIIGTNSIRHLMKLCVLNKEFAGRCYDPTFWGYYFLDKNQATYVDNMIELAWIGNEKLFMFLWELELPNKYKERVLILRAYETVMYYGHYSFARRILNLIDLSNLAYRHIPHEELLEEMKFGDQVANNIFSDLFRFFEEYYPNPTALAIRRDKLFRIAGKSDSPHVATILITAYSPVMVQGHEHITLEFRKLLYNILDYRKTKLRLARHLIRNVFPPDLDKRFTIIPAVLASINVNVSNDILEKFGINEINDELIARIHAATNGKKKIDAINKKGLLRKYVARYGEESKNVFLNSFRMMDGLEYMELLSKFKSITRTDIGKLYSSADGLGHDHLILLLEERYPWLLEDSDESS